MRIVLAVLFLCCAHASASDLKLWYREPATRWEQEALPIGNGRLGAMIFGDVEREHIQFNEDSLWIGDEDDTGAYQAFGDVYINFGSGGGIVSAECISGQASSAGQSVDASIDGDPDTKWCMEHQERPTVWVGHWPGGTVISSYAFTSGDDMPDRDPKSWTLEGSNDGLQWTQLDRRINETSFPNRHQRREYSLSNDKKFEHYRFTFFEHRSRTHCQVAEIELGNPTKAAFTNYRRELDIRRAVHTVSYTQGDVTYRREYFADHRSNVIVFRFSADRPGAYTGTVMLVDAHKAAVRALDNRLTAKGNLAGYTYKTKRPYNVTLDYEAQVLVANDGGVVEAKDGRIAFQNVNALTVYLDAGTDYVNQRSRNWRGAHPHEAITARLAQAVATPYDALLAAHTQDYQSLFNRLTLHLGATAEAVLEAPTDQRLVAYRGTASVATRGSMYDGNKEDPNIQGASDPGAGSPSVSIRALPDDQ